MFGRLSAQASLILVQEVLKTVNLNLKDDVEGDDVAFICELIDPPKKDLIKCLGVLVLEFAEVANYIQPRNKLQFVTAEHGMSFWQPVASMLLESSAFC